MRRVEIDNVEEMIEKIVTKDGKIGDRRFRNYIERFYKLNLISMKQDGVGGRYFITLNTPKDFLFEFS